ncbi:hypothetical protein ACLB2K_054160 [Fragaria x ananassa]
MAPTHALTHSVGDTEQKPKPTSIREISPTLLKKRKGTRHFSPITASFTVSVLLHPIKHVGTTSPSGSELQALVTEIIVTFSMMFITSAVATDTKAIGELAGIAVGSAVCITSIFAGTIGPALVSAYYNGIWIYMVGPVIGALLGAWSYSFIRVNDKPVQASPSRSLSLQLRRIKSDVHGQAVSICKDPLDLA